ncbi:MAG: P-loop NTPase fold protein [Bacteroidota bacterium]
MSEALSPATTVTEAFNAVNPNRPLSSDDPRYADFTEWRSPMPIADRLANLIVWPSKATPPEHVKVLFTGHKGSGKSTELRRLAAKLEAEGFFVVYFDAATEIDMGGVSYADVLLALMYQLVSAIHDSPVEASIKVEAVDSLRQRLAKITVDRTQTTESEIEAESGVEVTPGIPGLFKILSRLTVRLRGGESEKRSLRQEIDGDIGLFLEELNDLIRDLQIRLREHQSLGLVVIVDSLDRVILKTIDDEGRRTTHRELFIEHAEHLMAPACSMVYTIPVSLLNNQNVANVWGTTPELLPMVKVHDQEGNDSSDALDAMVDAVSLRIDIDSVFENSEDVRSLCRMSGGHLRDLMRLIRQACSYTADGEKISTEAVRNAIQEIVNGYQRSILDSELPRLVEIHRTHHLPNHEDCEDLPLKLLVLEYRNGQPWHDVHPAVLQTALFQDAAQESDGAA